MAAINGYLASGSVWSLTQSFTYAVGKQNSTACNTCETCLDCGGVGTAKTYLGRKYFLG